jgi:hypothetical protein
MRWVVFFHERLKWQDDVDEKTRTERSSVAAWWVVIESGAERSLAPARREVTRATYDGDFFDVPNIRPGFLPTTVF